MYDNDLNQYSYDPAYIDAPDALWFDDEDGDLYIIPSAESGYEIDGPDGPALDVLNTLCLNTEGRNPTVEEVEAVTPGLTYVPHALRRFHPQDGYYHA